MEMVDAAEVAMEGYQLTFFTQQGRYHHRQPLHQWLLKLIQSMEIRGATLVAAQEGLGSHHRIHSAGFFDLADQPIEVTVIVSAQECDALMQRLREESGLRLFYAKSLVEFGTIGQPDSP